MGNCSVAGCGNKHHSRGLCSKHYSMMCRGKLPNYVPPKSQNGKAMRWIMEHVNHSGDECLIWPYARTKAGYPNIRKANGSYAVASRVMCEQAHGKPGYESMEAAHSCGNGHLGCMNPGHLSWKTKKDNEKDKLIHGTHRNGDKSESAKLNWDIVRSIRKDALSMRNCDIARKYGIDPRHTHKIIQNRSWRQEFCPSD